MPKLKLKNCRMVLINLKEKFSINGEKFEVKN